MMISVTYFGVLFLEPDARRLHGLYVFRGPMENGRLMKGRYFR